MGRRVMRGRVARITHREITVHTELEHHAARKRGSTSQVVCGAGGEVTVEEQLFCGTTGE
jgi:hypothetical protein